MQSKNEQIQLSIHRKIQSIDDSLTFVRSFDSYLCRVYQVKRDNTQYILKYFDQIYNSEGDQHILNEFKALKLLADIPEYPNIIQLYNNHFDNKIAILKEFCEGESLAKSKKIINYKPLKKRLVSAVQIAHQRGIARLDLMPRNLILNTHERDAKILDLGDVLFRTENNLYSDFVAAKANDFHILRNWIFN